MGILEKLGLKKPPIEAFSRWLGEQVGVVFHGSAAGGQSDELDPALAELDQKVARFVSDHGIKALEQAVDLWVDRDGGSDILLIFLGHAWLDRATRRLAAGPSAGGFAILVQTLDRLGVSSAGELVGDPEWQPEARTAVPQMLEVVWPFTKAEEAIRVRLSELTRKDTRLIKWELFALRSWVLRLSVAGEFKDDLPRGEKLIAHVLKQVEARAADVPGPADFASWLPKRYEGYNAAVEPAAESGSTPLLTNAVGRRFALNFESGDSEVRSIGSKAFAISYRQLKALAEAWARNP